MSIIKCPKCNGSGRITVVPHPDSSVTQYEAVCESCGGKGYVTD